MNSPVEMNDLSTQRVMFLAGPGDATDVLRGISEGRENDGVAHVAYSRQVFNVCESMNIPVFSICTNDRLDDFQYGPVRSINIGDPLKNKRSLSFHFGNVKYAQQLMRFAKEFEATTIITGPEPHPFLLSTLVRRGVQVIPALNALLMPVFQKPSIAKQMLNRLNGRFFSRYCPAILCHPGLGVNQVRQIMKENQRPVVEFLPLYDSSIFADVDPPNVDANEFRILTVGRCEEFKGAFDLIEIARRSVPRSNTRLHFDWCGSGDALAEAKRRVEAKRLQDSVTFHGWTSMDDLNSLWSKAHLCIVPTTSRFVEGFNQVVIEAAIAGRPIITSRVCPSLDFVRPCAIEVTVDDVEGYVEGLLSLANDRGAYSTIQAKCARAVSPFFDPANSFGAAVRHILNDLSNSRAVSPIAHCPLTFE